ncbi:MAG TPA: RNA-binding protein [Terriglobales bacterium]|nr:RNA-binding protein [Terriglobales bacterium]
MPDPAVRTNVFVGNLASTTTGEMLRNIFVPFGPILSVTIVQDRNSGAPRGFAFVEMQVEADAEKAVSALDGKILDDRPLRVNLACPKDVDKNPMHEHMRRHRDHRL